MRKRIKYSFIGVMALGLVSVASFARAYPAIGAAIWPSFYGMEQAGPRVVVDKAMPVSMRADLLRDAETATSTVRNFYGAFHRQPYLVACSTEACDRELGGRGAMGDTYLTPFATVIRLSPRGANKTILTHEFSHVELHARLGLWTQITRAFPAWFDEGVAVVVSDDSRYLNPGATASGRCARSSEEPLPASGSGWGAKSGQDPMIYTDAACRVLQWMDAHGGKAGLLQALDATGKGVAFMPENGRRG